MKIVWEVSGYIWQMVVSENLVVSKLQGMNQAINKGTECV